MSVHIRAIKLAARDQRKADRRANRARRAAERRCFWTRPLGHEYALLEEEDGKQHRACIACGKPMVTA